MLALDRQNGGGVADRRRDLRAIANDLRIGKKPIDSGCVERRDSLGVEPREGLAEGLRE
jgi:hypothetical protein